MLGPSGLFGHLSLSLLHQITISDFDAEGKVYSSMRESAKKASELHLNLILISRLRPQHSGIASKSKIRLWNPLVLNSIQLMFRAAFQVYLPKVCTFKP